MILHSVSIAAIFAEQAQQAQCVVKCAPASAEPWWKWWVQSVIPVAGGTLIAVWSFVQNRNSEQKQWVRNQRAANAEWERNQDAAHEQWVRDHKKAEWQELLKAATLMRKVVSIGSESPLTRAQLIREGLKSSVQELEAIAASCVFLNDFFGDSAKGEQFYSYLREADLDIEGINSLFDRIQFLQVPSPDLTDQERQNVLVLSKLEAGNLAGKITNDIIVLNSWLRREAAISLETTNDPSDKASTTPSS